MTLPAELTISNQAGRSAATGSCWRRPGWSPLVLVLWALVAAVTFFGGTAAELLGLPAPHLITGLVAGLVLALTGVARRTGMVLPRLVYLAGQAIAGVRGPIST